MKTIERVKTNAHVAKEETDLEKNNRKMIRTIGQECVVLLKNNGVLPLKEKESVALYGKGVTNTVFGGSGSGEVNARYYTSVYEAFKGKGINMVTLSLLEDYREKAKAAHEEYDRQKIKKAGFLNFDAINMSNIKQGYEDIDFTLLKGLSLPDADCAIYILSRISGEGADRELIKGDYLLSDEEVENIHLIRKKYGRFVLILNTGGPVDLSVLNDIEIDAIVFAGMLGEEMGNSLLDILYGIVSPSGHLTFSWPEKYEDVPFGDEYALLKKENPELAEYKEDIFVGYRYYSSFNVPVKYPFGHGLSYTKFDLKASLVADRKLHFRIGIKNTGSWSGKCVPQIYVKKPKSTLTEPEYSLVSFAKSKELSAGESSEISADITYYAISSFDNERHCYILSQGRYEFYVGENVNVLTPFAYFELSKTISSTSLSEATHLNNRIDKLVNSQKSVDLDSSLKVNVDESLISIESVRKTQRQVNPNIRSLVDSLSLEELSYLLVGDGVTDMVIGKPHSFIVPGATGYSTAALEGKGIPSASFCDGPQGLRFARTSVVTKGSNTIKIVEPPLDMLKYMPKLIKMLGYSQADKGTPLYQYGSAFPCMTSLGCTWNPTLSELMGDCVGKEMEEYGVNVWLAPAMNIHRNPLCGRNYEYISEDPLLSGKIAAGIIKGVQTHRNKYATLKHFCCNNQETKRRFNNAVVSERALREIYLKGFEIAVKEGNAKALMSSYNSINGIHSDCSYGTLTNCLREEWGFKGIVVTDWDSVHEKEEAYLSIQSGITMRMGGSNKERKLIYSALKSGMLDLDLARNRVYENLLMIMGE